MFNIAPPIDRSAHANLTGIFVATNPAYYAILILCNQPVNIFADSSCLEVFFRQFINSKFGGSGESLIDSDDIDQLDNELIRKNIQRYGRR